MLEWGFRNVLILHLLFRSHGCSCGGGWPKKFPITRGQQTVVKEETVGAGLPDAHHGAGHVPALVGRVLHENSVTDM